MLTEVKKNSYDLVFILFCRLYIARNVSKNAIHSWLMCMFETPTAYAVVLNI